MRTGAVFKSPILQLPRHALILTLFLTLLTVTKAKAAPDGPPTIIEEETSTWSNIRQRTRLRSFTEIMTPALNGGDNSVPTPEGNALNPTNIYTVFSGDYEFVKNYRILFVQRFTLNPLDTSYSDAMSVTFKNPRLGLRRTNLFDSINISSTYDLYFQPGVSADANRIGKVVEFGLRTNTGYSVPGSRLSFGILTEFTYATYNNSSSKGNNIFGGSPPG